MWKSESLEESRRVYRLRAEREKEFAKACPSSPLLMQQLQTVQRRHPNRWPRLPR